MEEFVNPDGELSKIDDLIWQRFHSFSLRSFSTLSPLVAFFISVSIIYADKAKM